MLIVDERFRVLGSASPLAASVQSNREKNYIFVINHVVSYEGSLLRPSGYAGQAGFGILGSRFRVTGCGKSMEAWKVRG
jgi:hypothetical protein